MVDYKESGVDIEAGYEVVKRVKKLARSTFTKGVLGDIGFFGGLFEIDKSEFNEPVLVSGTDGVGTKLKIAFMTNNHKTVGIDAVAMCTNDVVVLGAKPLFFLDYLALNKIDPDVVEDILSGITDGCVQSGAALIGGETAEMSDLYGKGEYDIAGFCVGIVEKSRIIDGSKISAGDKLIGIASTGLHSNGFTLARKVLFDIAKYGVLDEISPLKLSLGEELLKPTKIYVKPILELLKDFDILGMAHITGGGLIENAARFLPHTCDAAFDSSSWPKMPIFSVIQEKGGIAKEEMYKTFNMGLGMVLAVKQNIADEVIRKLQSSKEKAYLVGEIVKGAGRVTIK